MTAIKVLALAAQFDRCEVHILSSLRNYGFEVTVVAEDGGAWSQEFARRGIECIPMKFRGRFDPRAVLRVRRLIKERGYTIVHCFSNRALTAAVFATRGLGIELVAYRGTIGHLSRFDPLSWTTFLFPGISRIVCVSEAVRRYLSGLVSSEKLVTIYKGHDVAWYAGARPRSLDEFGVPDGAFVVACVANVRPVKGIRYLVEAVARIPEDLGVHLLMVGRCDPQEVAKMAEGLPGLHRIHLTGFQSDVAGLLKSCHAFAMPSVAREGLPKALLEAMAVGVPAVVTDVGGMPEVVQSNINGLVVPPRNATALGEAILKFRMEPALCHSLAENAQRTIVERFNVDQSVAATAAVYRALAS